MRITCAMETHARGNNVLVRKDDTEHSIAIIDFDWAGKIGEARYPYFMKHILDWPERATDNVSLCPKHVEYCMD